MSNRRPKDGRCVRPRPRLCAPRRVAIRLLATRSSSSTTATMPRDCGLIRNHRPLEAKIVHWLIATSDDPSVSSEVIADTASPVRLAWTGPASTRFEQALVREAQLGDSHPHDGRRPPVTRRRHAADPRLSDVGRSDAAATIGAYWRNERFEADDEARIRRVRQAHPRRRLQGQARPPAYEEQHSATTRNASSQRQRDRAHRRRGRRRRERRFGRAERCACRQAQHPCTTMLARLRDQDKSRRRCRPPAAPAIRR
jgi:hypothetical protein